MSAFKTLKVDSNETIVYIQGARSKASDKDVASLVFQNYDDDTKRIYNMASVSCRDHYGNNAVDGAGDLVFKTNPNGTDMVECVRIDNIGNLGIGTSNPSRKLDVNGDVIFVNCEVRSNALIRGTLCNPSTAYFQNVTVGGSISADSIALNGISNNSVSYFADIYSTGTFCNNANVVLSNVRINGVLSMSGAVENTDLIVSGTLSNNQTSYFNNVYVASTLSNNSTSYLNTVNVSGTLCNTSSTYMSGTLTTLNTFCNNTTSYFNNVQVAGTLSNNSTSYMNIVNVGGQLALLGSFSNNNTSYLNTLNIAGPTTSLGSFSNNNTSYLNTLNIAGPTTSLGSFSNNNTSYLNLVECNSNVSIKNGYIVLGAVTTINTLTQSNIAIYQDTSDGLFKVKSYTSNVYTLNPLQSKGDTIVHDGITETRLPVGSIYQVTYANPVASKGISWGTLTTDLLSYTVERNKYLQIVADTATVYTTVTDIPYSTAVFHDTDAVTNVNNIDFKLNQNGMYTIFTNTTTIETAGNSIVTTQNNLAINTGAGYVTLSNTTNYFLNFNSTVATARGTGFSTVFLNATSSNYTIKNQLTRLIGTATVAINANNSTLGIFKFNIDGNDDSRYLQLTKYNNTTTTTTPVNITFTNTDIIHSTTYTYSLAAPDTITINETGLYLLVLCVNVTAQTASETTSQLQINVGSGFSVLNESTNITYVESATHFNGSSTSPIILNITVPGTSIRAQAICNVSTTSTIAPGTSLHMVKLQSITSGQSNVKHYNAYSTADTLVTQTFLDIPMTTTTLTNAIYTTSSVAGEVTCSETGFYLIFYKATVVNSSTNQTSTIQARIMVNKGSGFNELTASSSYVYVSNSPHSSSTISNSQIVFLQPGAIIKIQVAKLTNNGNIRLVPNACSLSIIKLDAESIAGPSVLTKFGNYYCYNTSSAASTTTSTSYVDKLLLITPYVPAGTYRIGISYQMTNLASKNQQVVVYLDEVTTVHDQTIIYATAATTIYTDFAQVTISEGIHTIVMRYRALSGTAGIQGTRLEFVRLS